MPWELQPLPQRITTPTPNLKPKNITTSRRYIPTLKDVEETSAKLYNLDVNWDAPTIEENGIVTKSPWTIGYEVEVKSGELQEWNLRTRVKDNFMTFPNVAFATYYVRIRTVVFGGSMSDWVESFAIGTPGPYTAVFNISRNSMLITEF